MLSAVQCRKIAAVAVAAAMTMWAVAASAGNYVGLTGGLSKTPPTPDFPGSGSKSFGLNGNYDWNDSWSTLLTLSNTRPTPAPDTSTAFAGKTKDGSSFLVSLGSSWTPAWGWNKDEHWSFDFGLGLSPRSVSLSSTTISYDVTGPKGGTTTSEQAALLKSSSSSINFALGVNYDTNGDSDYETSFSLGVWPSRVVSLQTVEELQAANGSTLTKDQLLQDCQKGAAGKPPKAMLKACKKLMPLLKSQEASVVTMPIFFSVTESIKSNTDVTLGGTYYVYSQNPNDVGYFTLAAQGKQSQNASASFGSGISVSPYLFGSTATVAHKFGPLKVTVGGSYNRYLPEDDGTYGHSTSGAIKAAWKITDAWRVNGAFGKSWDTDSDGAVTSSYSVSLGLRFTFVPPPPPPDEDEDADDAKDGDAKDGDDARDGDKKDGDGKEDDKKDDGDKKEPAPDAKPDAKPAEPAKP